MSGRVSGVTRQTQGDNDDDDSKLKFQFAPKHFCAATMTLSPYAINFSTRYSITRRHNAALQR